LQELASRGRAQVVNRYGQKFWSAVDARYASQSRDPRLQKHGGQLQATSKPGADGKESAMEELAVNASSIPWEPAAGYHPGTMRKILRRGAGGEPLAVLLELSPGFEMGSHAHLFVEHHYVLAGEYESDGNKFPAGSYRVIPKGKEHGPFRSPKGATVLVLWTE
jgi:hypothetical protein